MRVSDKFDKYRSSHFYRRVFQNFTNFFSVKVRQFVQKRHIIGASTWAGCDDVHCLDVSTHVLSVRVCNTYEFPRGSFYCTALR